jgi:hypothetical protein
VPRRLTQPSTPSTYPIPCPGFQVTRRGGRLTIASLEDADPAATAGDIEQKQAADGTAEGSLWKDDPFELGPYLRQIAVVATLGSPPEMALLAELRTLIGQLPADPLSGSVLI